MLLKNPMMSEKTWGADLIGAALAQIITWKVWNSPRLATDETAFSILSDKLRRGGIEFIRPDNPYHGDRRFEPTIGRILDGIRYRLIAETDHIFEEHTRVPEKRVDPGHVTTPLLNPEAGYGDTLAQVVEWYTSLDDPLKTIGDAMSPVTIGYMLEPLSKRDFIARLAPALGRDSTLPGLPSYEHILGPLAYGQSILLGDFLIKVSEDALPAFGFRLVRNTPMPFDVIHTQLATKEEIMLSPQDLYATMIDYVVSIMTPGKEDGSRWPDDGDATTNFYEGSWSLGTPFSPGETEPSALTEIEAAVIPTFSHEESDNLTGSPKFKEGGTAMYFDSPVKILAWSWDAAEETFKYRATSLDRDVVVNEKNWIPEFRLKPELNEDAIKRGMPNEKTMTDWEKDIWWQIRHADRASAEVLYAILEKGPKD